MTKSDWLAHLHPSLPSDWPVLLHALPYHLIGRLSCMLSVTIPSPHFVLLLLLLLNYHPRFNNQHSDTQMLAILQPQGSWIPLVVKTDLCSSLMGKWVPPFLGEGII